MTFITKLRSQEPTFSLELLTPSGQQGWIALYGTLGRLRRIAPDFVSLTCEAGRPARGSGHDLLQRLRSELDTAAVPQITDDCLNGAELPNMLDQFQEIGVSAMLVRSAAQTADIVARISSHHSFDTGCICIPEQQARTGSLADLRRMQDAGAAFAVTQPFFDSAAFYRFRDLAAAGGISIPIIASILPVSDMAQPNFAEPDRGHGASVPRHLVGLVSQDGAAVAKYGIEHAVAQCDDLLRNGVAGIHLHAMNSAKAASEISKQLQRLGHFSNACSV